MKKWIAMLCAAILCLCAAGCGGKTAGPIDAEGLANDLLENVTFERAIERIDASKADILYPGLPEGTEAVIYAASGAGADEVTILTAADEADVLTVLEAANQYIERQKESYANYNPAELSKLEQAIVLQKGNSVIVCVTNDAQTAADRIEEFCK